MIRRSRRSTLFPYTTLFRSLMVEGDQHHGIVIHHLDRDVVALVGAFLECGERSLDCNGQGPPRLGRGDEDRKSTRLNSSHLGISYAVFCLKKKKKKKYETSS